MSADPAPKTVLVTGSSRGIGRAIAARLGSLGWRVILHASRPESLTDDVRRETKAVGEIVADLADPASAVHMMLQAKAFGRLDAVVNNAGVYRPFAYDTPDDDAFLEGWGETMAVNLIAPSLDHARGDPAVRPGGRRDPQRRLTGGLQGRGGGRRLRGEQGRAHQPHALARGRAGAEGM